MPATQNLLATMITTTTYGTWLPGDLRGYVEKGVILPGEPKRLEHSQELLQSDPVLLTRTQQHLAFDALWSAAREFSYTLIAISVESWHAHWLIDHGFDDVKTMTGRLKTQVRQALDCGRIWTRGFDARYCFDGNAVQRRRDYIERHAGWRPLSGA